MEKVTYLLQKWASGKRVFWLFIVTMTVYLTMLLYTIPTVGKFAPETPLFDLSPAGYSYESAIALLETLGTEGRATYLTLQLPLDFIYPALFIISNSLLLTWLFSKVYIATSKVYYLAIIPFFGGLFDYLENIFIILMINSFPNVSPALSSLASAFTILKSGFTTLFYFLLIWALFQFFKNKRKVSDS